MCQHNQQSKWKCKYPFRCIFQCGLPLSIVILKGQTLKIKTKRTSISFAQPFWAVFNESYKYKALYHSIVCSIEICLRSIKNASVRSKMPPFDQKCLRSIKKCPLREKVLFPLIMNISCEKNIIKVVHGECRGIMVIITCQPWNYWTIARADCGLIASNRNPLGRKFNNFTVDRSLSPNYE